MELFKKPPVENPVVKDDSSKPLQAEYSLSRSFLLDGWRSETRLLAFLRRAPKSGMKVDRGFPNKGRSTRHPEFHLPCFKETRKYLCFPFSICATCAPMLKPFVVHLLAQLEDKSPLVMLSSLPRYQKRESFAPRGNV